MDRPCSRPTSEHACGAIEQKEHHAMPRKFNTAIVTIGIDPGKNTLHLVGLDARGGIVLREKVARARIVSQLANVPPCLIGIEAGMGTHYVTRELLALGHDVRQVPPVYAKPFRQTHKNDFRDAHAIAEAVQRRTRPNFLPWSKLAPKRWSWFSRPLDRCVSTAGLSPTTRTSVIDGPALTIGSR